jgi:spore maturation protein CgeB
MVKNKADTQTVLFCGPIDHPVNSGRYMIAGLEELGYKVIGYDYRTHSDAETELLQIVEKEKPRYVFTLKGEALSPRLIQCFKEHNCVTILWLTMLNLRGWIPALALAHDFVVTNVEDHIDLLKVHGVKHVCWIHQGFSPAHFGIDGPRSDDVREYYSDVALIGSMGGKIYHKRCQMVMRLLREKINVRWWGLPLSRQLKNLRYFLGGVHGSWAGKEAYMKDFADVIRHTKIFLGQDGDGPPPGRHLSNRSFAVVGCGGFYLCRRTSGIEHVYKVGKEVEVFDTDDEMVDKVRYYLENDEARKRIALAGQKKVLEHFTYRSRMEEILNWVNDQLREQIWERP